MHPEDNCPRSREIILQIDEELNIDLPQFGLNDISAIADFVENKLVGKRNDETALFVNGQPDTLNRFAQDIVTGAIIGMLSTLKDVNEDIKSVEITFRKKVG
jgi:hypothetical protein